MRRLLNVLKAAWTLLRDQENQTWREPEPVAVPSGTFNFEQDSYLANLVKEPEFFRMLDALCADESAQLSRALRDDIRNQRHHEAAQTEAALAVFEDLKKVFKNYAAAYSAESRKARATKAR